MTEHWNEHSLDFSRSSDKKFDSAEGNWDANETGFTIDTPVTDDDMEERRKVYAEPNPDVENLQRRQGYTNQVRADPSYRFLMMVAAFSKKKLGTIMNVKQRNNIKTTTTYNDQFHIAGRDSNNNPKIAQNIAKQEKTSETKQEMEDDDGGGEVGENFTKIGGKSWVTMPEISGSIQLTPEVYGHIREAQMIVGGFTKRTILLKTLVENQRYQTLFARLVAVRMGLTKYFYNSDKQKDRIFSRLHQEQSMLLRRIRTVKGEPTKDYTNPGGYY